MSNTVSAAATGLPSVSRRSLAAGVAVAAGGLVSPALSCADDSEDARLLTLYAQWRLARAAWRIAADRFNAAEAQVVAHHRTFPAVAAFRTETKAGALFHDGAGAGDDHWQELRDLARRTSSAGYEYRDDAYVEMRERVELTAWRRHPDFVQVWQAPYCPPLRDRVREILAAYEPWEAEHNRVKTTTGLDDAEEAMVAADRAVMALEKAIARVPARGERGWRIKATIMAVAFTSRDAIVDQLADDSTDNCAALEMSIILDLADWHGGAA